MNAPKHKSLTPEWAGVCEPPAGAATVSMETAPASDPAHEMPFVITCLAPCSTSYSLAAFRTLQSLGSTLSDVPFDDPRVVVERRVCTCGRTLRIPIDCDGNYLADGVW